MNKHQLDELEFESLLSRIDEIDDKADLLMLLIITVCGLAFVFCIVHWR